jgi:hypothetical protein
LVRLSTIRQYSKIFDLSVGCRIRHVLAHLFILP